MHTWVRVLLLYQYLASVCARCVSCLHAFFLLLGLSVPLLFSSFSQNCSGEGAAHLGPTHEHAKGHDTLLRPGVGDACHDASTGRRPSEDVPRRSPTVLLGSVGGRHLLRVPLRTCMSSRKLRTPSLGTAEEGETSHLLAAKACTYNSLQNVHGLCSVPFSPVPFSPMPCLPTVVVAAALDVATRPVLCAFWGTARYSRLLCCCISSPVVWER